MLTVAAGANAPVGLPASQPASQPGSHTTHQPPACGPDSQWIALVGSPAVGAVDLDVHESNLAVGDHGGAGSLQGAQQAQHSKARSTAGGKGEAGRAQITEALSCDLRARTWRPHTVQPARSQTHVVL